MVPMNNQCTQPLLLQQSFAGIRDEGFGDNRDWSSDVCSSDLYRTDGAGTQKTAVL